MGWVNQWPRAPLTAVARVCPSLPTGSPARSLLSTGWLPRHRPRMPAAGASRPWQLCSWRPTTHTSRRPPRWRSAEGRSLQEALNEGNKRTRESGASHERMRAESTGHCQRIFSPPRTGRTQRGRRCHHSHRILHPFLITLAVRSAGTQPDGRSVCQGLRQGARSQPRAHMPLFVSGWEPGAARRQGRGAPRWRRELGSGGHLRVRYIFGREECSHAHTVRWPIEILGPLRLTAIPSRQRSREPHRTP